MTKFFSTVAVCCVCMSVLLLGACKKKPDEVETKEGMLGRLLHNVPSYLYKSRTYTVTASGITSPTEGVGYTWKADYFAPASSDAQSYTFRTPDEVGAYTVSLSASHVDYYDVPTSQVVTVIDSLFFNSLTGVVEGTNAITDPRDGAVYHTRAYGDLEWFVHNLDWGGAGNAYGKVEALSTPFGRLYSWNEAVSGMAGAETPGVAATGLGQGPQGVCPPGWSIPTNEDWVDLATVVNGGVPLSFFDNWDGVADPLCAYAKLNEDHVWPYSPRNNKSNTAAWNGLPGGNGENNGNHFRNLGSYGFWLSSSEADAENGYYRYINYDLNRFPYHHTDKNSFGASVRCVRMISR